MSDTSPWVITEKLCGRCGRHLFGRSHLMRVARSLQPLPVIWESRCFNAECPESRRHKTQATASLPI
jgi:hypothetical protein